MGQEFCFTSFSKKMRYPVKNTEYLIFLWQGSKFKIYEIIWKCLSASSIASSFSAVTCGTLVFPSPRL